MKAGDLVRCKENEGIEHILVVGDIYEVVEALTNLIGVRTPDGIFRFAKFRFEPLGFSKTETTKHYEIENEQVFAFDVDDTLVLERPGVDLHENAITLTNPYSDSVLFRLPHVRHIELLKQQKARGRFVVVWSGGGVKWARHVVEKLGLLPYVDLILTKPIGYVDDQHSSEWLNNKIYLPHED